MKCRTLWPSSVPGSTHSARTPRTHTRYGTENTTDIWELKQSTNCTGAHQCFVYMYIYVIWSTKSSHKQHRYIYRNSQKYVVWVKMGRSLTHTHCHTHMHAHAHMHTHRHSLTHSHTHTHTHHTHTHTHTHTESSGENRVLQWLYVSRLSRHFINFKHQMKWFFLFNTE